MQNCWHWRPEKGISWIENEENFITLIKKIKNVLKIWRIRNLTVYGKIKIFKSLAISKVIQLALVDNVPHVIIDRLSKIQKEFLFGIENTTK